MNNNHCRFLFILFKARIIEIASSSASCKKGGIYSYKVEVTFAIDKKHRRRIASGICISLLVSSGSVSDDAAPPWTDQYPHRSLSQVWTR